MVTIHHPNTAFTGPYQAGARLVQFQAGVARDVTHPHAVAHFYRAPGFTVHTVDETLEPPAAPAGEDEVPGGVDD